MLKKLFCVVLVGLLINVVHASSVVAASNDEKKIAQVRESIAKLGTGVDARVEVKLRDKTKLKGYIAEAGADSFVIIDAKTRMPVTVAYPQVKQVKGHNLSTGAKIAIGIGIGIGVLAVVVLVFKDRIVAY